MNDNVIEFPNNDKRYIRLGTEALENNELEMAIWYFEQAYKIEPSGEVNFLLVSALSEDNQTSEALEIANEQMDFYKNNENYNMTYVSLLISNQMFDEAREIIDGKLTGDFESRNVSEWHRIHQFLVNEESKIQEQIEEYKNNLVKKLYSLNALSIDEQLKIVDNAEILGLNQLQRIAPFVFKGPNIHHFAKVGFLQHLIKKQDNSTYDFEWLHRKRTFQPTHLSLFNEHELVTDVQNQLANRLEKNPSLKEIVSNELNYHLMLLYPFINEAVTDKNLWVELYIDKFQNKESSLENLDQESLKMKKWQDYLSQLEYRY